MKKSYKLALLAALGLVSATAAQAAYTYGDLVLGIAQASGPANAANIDIGTLASLESAGSTNLSSQLAADGFGSSLSASAVFGIVGYSQQTYLGGSGTLFLSTDSTGDQPNAVSGSANWNSIRTAMSTLTANQGQQAYNGGLDYSYQTQIGNNGLSDALSINPSSVITDVANLYSIPGNGGAPVLDGTLSFNPTTEVLTITTVPEPTTLSLIGGAGLLVLAFRNKLNRKQA